MGTGKEVMGLCTNKEVILMPEINSK